MYLCLYSLFFNLLLLTFITATCAGQNWMLRATWRSPCLDLLCFFTTNSEHPPAAVRRTTAQDEHLTCHAWHFFFTTNI